MCLYCAITNDLVCPSLVASIARTSHQASYTAVLEEQWYRMQPSERGKNATDIDAMLNLAVLPALMGRYQAGAATSGGANTTWISHSNLEASRWAAAQLTGRFTDKQWGLIEPAPDVDDANYWSLGCDVCPHTWQTDMTLNLWAIWLLREAGKLKPAGGDAAAKAVGAPLLRWEHAPRRICRTGFMACFSRAAPPAPKPCAGHGIIGQNRAQGDAVLKRPFLRAACL